MENHIFIYNEIGAWGNTADEIQGEINKLPGANELVIHLSSPGGEVFEGWTIGNIIKNSGKKVTVIIEGLCASIATYIALQADVIKMSETGRFMIHNPSMGMEGEEKDFQSASEQLASIKKDLIKSYKLKTGLNEDELSQMMDDATWMSADRAKELGFVDLVIGNVKAVAKFNIHKMEDTKQKSKLDTLTDQMFSALDRLEKVMFKNEGEEPENMNVTLADGTTIFIESEDGELEGKQAFTVDEEGNKTDTPAPEGTHDLEDGRSITVNAEGVVESVQEAAAEDEEKVALQNEIAELKSQLAATNSEKETLTNEMSGYKDSIKDIQNQMKEIKSLTVGGEAIVAKGNTKPVDKKGTVVEEKGGLENWAKSNFKIK